MIKEAYCSREVAKLLKEKGFNETVHYEYHYTISIPQFHKKSHNFNGDEYVNCSSEWYSAPTHQMAMAWLREEKNIFIVIEPHAYDYVNEKTSSYVFAIWEGDNYMEVYSYKNSELHGISYLTYEEAVETALKYTLEKLI